MRRSTSVNRVTRLAATSIAVTAFSLMAVSPVAAQAKQKPKGPKAAAVDIMLMQPTALKAGENQFEVMVKGAEGKPLNGADVSLVFVMPATPTMGEMRNEVKPAAAGTYIGPGNVMMVGKWNVTVSVKQSGKEVGQKKVALTAR